MFNRFAPYPSEVIQNYLAWSHHVNIIDWPTWLKSFFPRFLLLDSNWYRIPNIVLSMAILLAITKLTYLLTHSKQQAFLTALLLSITPMFIHTAIFDFMGLLILLLAICGLVLGQLRKWTLCIFCILLYTLAVIHTDNGWQLYLKHLPNKAAIKLEVDDRIHTEYRINNQHNIIPIQLKRLVYNKYYWTFRLNLPEWFKVWDFDWWLAPSQIGSTVSRSLWGEKGLPRIFFWQAILTLTGIFYLSKHKNFKIPLLCLFLAVWIISSLSVAENFERSTLPLLIPMSLLAGVALHQIRSQRYGKILMTIIFIVSAIGVFSTWNHILNHELYWRDNRPYIYSQIIQFIDSCPATSRIIATNLIGPSQYYYAWQHVTDPKIFWSTNPNTPKIDNIVFKHFDLTKSSETASCLIGLPGEFLGNRNTKTSGQNDFLSSELPSDLHLVKSIFFRDSVSYGNGNQLWLVQKDL